MPEFFFELIPGGYQIFRDGALYIDQPFAPGEPGKRLLSESESIEYATQTIAELQELFITPAAE